jgi:hypothetical protein
MDINWKKITTYTVGGVAGAVVGIFIAQFVMDVIATQKYYREIEEMDKDMDGEKVRPVLDHDLIETEVLTNGWKLKAKNAKVNYNAVGEKESIEAVIGKYKRNSESVPDEPTPTEYVDEEEDKPRDVDHSKPYPISSEQYITGFDAKKKTTKIYFYTDDEIFTDEDGKVLAKPEKYLGTDIINAFGGPSGDPDVAYIRNEKLKCDYHVIAVNEAYGSGDENEAPLSRKANEERD